ncbi:MAG: saccharopine dehydrogenase C-terminal domain-containing protein [Planctomycetota bacterium]|jgi:saccharopine dehydrogenase-like NADP-dependent oxidoreductase|nr:saccharopine dehydrogenase C-terminal domain-containing protein [Planctomycetota bacterium]
MASVLVLGSGMVGSAISQDLATRHSVIASDFDAAPLTRLECVSGISTLQLDVLDTSALRAAASEVDMVVSAVPGALGFQVLSTLIEAGKNVTDISFFPEEALDLHDLAVEKGSIVVTDMGVAPGLDNLIFGHHNTSMKISRFECMVGGLPKNPTPPWFYKAPFSPMDVIEEYLRPARMVENGREVVKPALTDPELIDFEKVGTLEAFNTDGLRSLLRTMKHVPDMVEKTLRFPGHREQVLSLLERGSLREEATSAMLKSQWALGPKEEEFTVMRVTVEGEEGGVDVRHVWDLYDEFDSQSGVSSMARTTGYTCTGMAECILDGSWNTPGVSPGELVGGNAAVFNRVLSHLKDRGIEMTKSP